MTDDESRIKIMKSFIALSFFRVSISSVWFKEGPRSYNNSWQFASVKIGARTNFQIQFIGERGRSFQGDIGIDDVKLIGCRISELM